MGFLSSVIFFLGSSQPLMCSKDMEDALKTFKEALSTEDDQEVYAATVDCAHAGVPSVVLGRLVREAGFEVSVALTVFRLYKEVKEG